jgi:hypothetical protein
MSNLFYCDCSSNGYPLYKPCSSRSCGGDISSNINLQMTEKRIQNQVRVAESQYTDVLGAVTIANDYLDSSANYTNASMVWGNRFNLRNQSDRRAPHGMVNTNVPTRGNSTRTTITGNKPGAMTPGGYGVDVKHGSYARYLGKLKGRKMALGALDGSSVQQPVVGSVMNNKSYRFTLVNTQHCKCDGKPIVS